MDHAKLFTNMHMYTDTHICTYMPVIKLTSRSIGNVVAICGMKPNAAHICLCWERVAALRAIGGPQFHCRSREGGREGHLTPPTILESNHLCNHLTQRQRDWALLDCTPPTTPSFHAPKRLIWSSSALTKPSSFSYLELHKSCARVGVPHTHCTIIVTGHQPCFVVRIVTQ